MVLIVSRPKLGREEKLKEKCQSLLDIVRQVAPLYLRSVTTELQRHYIETVIGAAIWYLPEDEFCWTGNISLEAIRSYHPDNPIKPKALSKDHDYPRKLAAVELLTKDWAKIANPLDELIRLYREKFGRFNYITQTENRRLMQHQRKGVFTDSATAYKNASIELVPINLDTLKKIKRKDRSVVEHFIQQYI